MGHQERSVDSLVFSFDKLGHKVWEGLVSSVQERQIHHAYFHRGVCDEAEVFGVFLVDFSLENLLCECAATVPERHLGEASRPIELGDQLRALCLSHAVVVLVENIGRKEFQRVCNALGGHDGLEGSDFGNFRDSQHYVSDLWLF